ncbi:MAG: tetratricopeptide repeat protein [Phycisphaerales bacterium]
MSSPVSPAPGESGEGARARAVAAPTGQVTLIFTDLQGSTELWEKLQSRMAEALAAHNAVMRGLIAKHQGYEVKTEGDAFMIAFASPTMAVRFALELQQQMATAMPEDIRRDTNGAELLVRMGIHTGEPICELDPTNGRMDYFGPMVNRSARISAAGHGGQILVSHAVREAATEELESALVKDLGEHRLKSLSRPERLFQVLPYELASRTYPPLKTLDHVATNLPYQQTTFVGRRTEITELTIAFREDKWNLLTLTGPGGTGKTRLSLRVGNELLDHYEGGVWFADLSECTTPDGVCAQVAAAFGVPIAGPEPPQQVIAAVLEYRKPLLLILDNFEQVVESCAAMIGMWMKRARTARFLATSRTLLGIAGEQEYRLEPMRTPPRLTRPRDRAADEGLDRGTVGIGTIDPEHDEEASRAQAELDASLGAQHAVRLSQFDVVRLFVERAREAQPGFTLTDENAPDVADICIELEGAPLAIELAAARVKILKPAQIVQKLSKKFELLRSSRRDLPKRQQTLEGAIDWSWDLLKPHERAALCQVCVFRGGLFLEQAEEVLDLSAFPEAPLAMDVVQALREQSLLSSVDTPAGLRLKMFQSIRAYAERKLVMQSTPTETRELELRHARCYAALAEHWDARRGGRDAAEAFDHLELECENLFAAQDRALTHHEPLLSARCILAVAVTMAIRGLSVERVPRLRATLEGVETTLAQAPKGSPVARALQSARSRLIVALCQACQDLGRWDEAQQLAEQAMTHAQSSDGGAAHHLGAALVQIGEMHRLRGRFDAALEAFDRAASEFRAAKAHAGEARALGGRGSVLWQQERFDEAIDCFTRASAVFEKLGNQGGTARNIGGQGLALASRGDPAAALACYDKAEAVYRGTRNKSALARTLGNRALALELSGDIEGALRCLHDAEALNREMGARASVARNVGNRGGLLLAKDAATALECFDDALRIHEELGNRQGVALAAERRGKALAALGRHEEARSAFERALNEYAAIGLGHTTNAQAVREALERGEGGGSTP